MITFTGSVMGQEVGQVVDNASSVLCSLVNSSDLRECIELTESNSFEVVAAELCEYRIGSNEMLDCFKAIKNKTFEYTEVLDCAKTQSLGIIGCLSGSGSFK